MLVDLFTMETVYAQTKPINFDNFFIRLMVMLTITVPNAQCSGHKNNILLEETR